MLPFYSQLGQNYVYGLCLLTFIHCVLDDYDVYGLYQALPFSDYLGDGDAYGMCLLPALSAGFRTNEAPCLFTYEAPYLGPEGGRPDRPTQAVRHACSGSLGIVNILRYIKSDMYTASVINSKIVYITQSPNPPKTVLHRSHDEIVKLDKKRTERAVITVNIM